MYHLLLVTCLIAFTFGILLLRHAVEIAYTLLAWFPTRTFLIAITHEFVRGIQQFNHQLLHVAFDSSYALSLLGLFLMLRAVIKRKRMIIVLKATLIAGIPWQLSSSRNRKKSARLTAGFQPSFMPTHCARGDAFGRSRPGATFVFCQRGWVSENRIDHTPCCFHTLIARKQRMITA